MEAVALTPPGDDNWCFPVQREMNHSTLSTYFKRMCAAAGVQGIHFRISGRLILWNLITSDALNITLLRLGTGWWLVG